MHGMGGQILPRGYLGITPPDVECIHGLGGMDSTMEHACATSRADKNPDGSEIQVLHSISLISIGQNGLAIGVKFQLPENFPKRQTAGTPLSEREEIVSTLMYLIKLVKVQYLTYLII